MFDKAKARVQCQNSCGEYINSRFGVLQGGILSPKLFNEFMSDLSEHLQKVYGITINDQTLTRMLYAHDIVLLSDTPSGLQNNINALHTFCARWHLILNTEKNKSNDNRWI